MTIPEQIAAAKSALPLPSLLAALGVEWTGHDIKSPFRDEKNASFGLYKKADGAWNWKDQGSGRFGDEIDYLQEAEGTTRDQARERFLELAGVQTGDRSGDIGAGSRPRPVSRGRAVDSGRTRPVANVAAGASSFDWHKCSAAFDAECLEETAAWRGIDRAFLSAIHDQGLIGTFDGCPAFPVQDGDKVIGAHYREEDGTWRFTPGARSLPFVFQEGKPRRAFVFESQWDALALASAVGLADSLFFTTRGASNGKAAGALAGFRGEIVIVPQNDASKDGQATPAEKWTADVIAALGKRSTKIVRVPAQYKDANDWFRDCRDVALIVAAVDNAADPELDNVEHVGFKALLAFDAQNDPNSILGDRWLCTGSACMFVGQSGIGKSSLALQLALTWALNEPAFGIKPARPLRSLFIQAENDNGDLAEMAQGYVRAVSAMSGADITQDGEIMARMSAVSFIRDTVHTGEDFVNRLRKLIAKFKPDLVWIDPLLSYIGDDISDQKVTSTFLRNQLGALLMETGVIAFLMHHTPKPSTDKKAKSGWSDNDFSYSGQGSSELTNWPRAICVLEELRGQNAFALRLSKRGKRAGAVDIEGNPTRKIWLKQAEGREIFWFHIAEPADSDDKKSGAGRPAKGSTADVLKELSTIDGIKVSALRKRLSEQSGIGKTRFFELWATLKFDRKIEEKEGGLWVKIGSGSDGS